MQQDDVLGDNPESNPSPPPGICSGPAVTRISGFPIETVQKGESRLAEGSHKRKGESGSENCREGRQVGVEENETESWREAEDVAEREPIVHVEPLISSRHGT